MMVKRRFCALSALLILTACVHDEENTGPGSASVGTSISAGTLSGAGTSSSGASSSTGTPTTSESGSAGEATGSTSTTQGTTIDTTLGTSMDTSMDSDGTAGLLEAAALAWCTKYLACFPGKYPTVEECVNDTQDTVAIALMNADDPVGCAAAILLWRQCATDSLCRDPSANACYQLLQNSAFACT